jgi:hypothetical protein
MMMMRNNPTPPPPTPAAIPELEAVDYSNAIMAIADDQAVIQRLRRALERSELEAEKWAGELAQVCELNGLLLDNLNDTRRFSAAWKRAAKEQRRIVAKQAKWLEEASKAAGAARRSLETLRAVLGRVLSDFAALAMTAPWAENVRLQRELQIAELAAEKYGGELAHSSELNGLLLDTNARLRQALDEFGGHKAGCGAACAYKCDCGFAEAVE